MAGYRLTTRAARELDEIFVHGTISFGERQAEKYLVSLEDCFSLLAANPLLGRSIAYARKRVRRHDHARHAIIYRPDGDGVIILAVVHGHASRRRLRPER